MLEDGIGLAEGELDRKRVHRLLALIRRLSRFDACTQQQSGGHDPTHSARGGRQQLADLQRSIAATTPVTSGAENDGPDPTYYPVSPAAIFRCCAGRLGDGGLLCQVFSNESFGGGFGVDVVEAVPELLAEEAKDHDRGRRWLLRWHDDQGSAPKRSFTRKTDAETFDLQIRAEAGQGLYRYHRAGKELFQTYAEQWLNDRDIDLSSRALWRRQLDHHIYPRFGTVPLARIKPSAVSGWLKRVPGADVTRRGIFDLLRAILDAAVDDDILPKNPARAKSVVPPKIPATEAVAWEAEHVRGLRDLLPEHLAATPTSSDS